MARTTCQATIGLIVFIVLSPLLIPFLILDLLLYCCTGQRLFEFLFPFKRRENKIEMQDLMDNLDKRFDGWCVKIRCGPSEICGRGVFFDEDVKAGTIFYDWNKCPDELKLTFPNTEVLAKYLVRCTTQEQKQFIFDYAYGVPDGMEMQANPLIMVNHSSDPKDHSMAYCIQELNDRAWLGYLPTWLAEVLWYVGILYNVKTSCCLYTIRDVKKGQEMFEDYTQFHHYNWYEKFAKEQGLMTCCTFADALEKKLKSEKSGGGAASTSFDDELEKRAGQVLGKNTKRLPENRNNEKVVEEQ